MLQQCALLLFGINPMGHQLYRLVGVFDDCEPILVVNDIDPNLLRNPSQLKLEVVRRAFQVPRGGVGVGKRVDHQGELVDGYEVINQLQALTDVQIGVHPSLIGFIAGPLSSCASIFEVPPPQEPEFPDQIDEPIGGVLSSEGLQAPIVSDKVVDNDPPSSEDKKDEPVDNVHTTELPTGEPAGDGSQHAGGDKPRAVTVGKGPKR